VSWYRWHGDTLVLVLRVQPRAREDAFGEPLGDALRVRNKAPPVDGKANVRLVVFLAGAFGVPRERVRIARGTQGRSKLVCIDAPVVLPLPLTESSTGSRDGA
jgi:uncharacterized protein (TIGR00251 family)